MELLQNIIGVLGFSLLGAVWVMVNHLRNNPGYTEDECGLVILFSASAFGCIAIYGIF